jgi:hypothetical protein
MFGACNPEHPEEDAVGENKQVGPYQSLLKQTIAFLNDATYLNSS